MDAEGVGDWVQMACSGGGSLFADSQEATLVYRDDECGPDGPLGYEDRDRDVDTSLPRFWF